MNNTSIGRLLLRHRQDRRFRAWVEAIGFLAASSSAVVFLGIVANSVANWRQK